MSIIEDVEDGETLDPEELKEAELREFLIDTASQIIEDIEEILDTRLIKKRSDYGTLEDFEDDEVAKIYGEVYFNVEDMIVDHIRDTIESYSYLILEYLDELDRKDSLLYNLLTWISEKEDIPMEELKEMCFCEFCITEDDWERIFKESSNTDDDEDQTITITHF